MANYRRAMPLRLTVARSAWHEHVATQAAAYGDALVPVVKGNGYGFGRNTLVAWLDEHHPQAMFAVGNVHEAPAHRSCAVLTPTLIAPERTDLLLTIGHPTHVAALRGWRGSVMVKVQSSMRRYGVPAAEVPSLVEAAEAAGLDVAAIAMHLPLAGTDLDRLAEVHEVIATLDQHGLSQPLWLSHLSPASLQSVAAAHPHRRLRIRVGTQLWLGSPKGSFLHLSANVTQVTAVAAGDTAGYRHTAIPYDGHLVCIDTGSAHGVAQLDGVASDRSSPFHFARQRMALLEPPHMHTSLVVVPNGQPCPSVGDRVDVQRPLITTAVDDIEWTD